MNVQTISILYRQTKLTFDTIRVTEQTRTTYEQATHTLIRIGMEQLTLIKRPL